ncbi:MAG: Stk1 family PASTA domain-containing Ser/Thr kinase [Coriobacteriales bacterium]|jgi:serine/threonine-protein kinase|nr:Stk1 family PASTA domain-containing Ser/Thr kinase [Coriobacteriales bacterium]
MAEKLIAGRYQLLEVVGSGGMAQVWRATDNVLGRAVAVKVMLPQYADDHDFAVRFKQEAQAAANLASPYIVNIYDWGHDDQDNTYYIVMEYVRGTDLKTLIRQEGALPQEQVAQIAQQVASALDTAHGYDVIHRDIKPQNIMIGPSGNAKVMDFGIARANEANMTQTGSVLGSAYYVSPEQAQGKALAGTSDLYSLGVVMYEALTGQVPFDGSDPVSVAVKQVNEAPRPLEELRPDIDPGLAAIVERAMDKDPSRRFPTAKAMQADLGRYLAGQPVATLSGEATSATRVIDQVPRASQTAVMPQVGGSKGQVYSDRGRASQNPARRHRKWPWVLLIVVVLAAIVGAIFLVRSCSAPQASVPNVINQTQDVATQTLTQSGFTVGQITFQPSTTVAQGVVISQDPAPGSTAAQGSGVALIVSSGTSTTMAAVPSVSGLGPDAAAKKITAAGFVPLRGPDVTEQSSSYVSGKVCQQSPESGTQQLLGSTVTYQVYVPPAPTMATVPPLVGVSKADAKKNLSNAGLSGSYSTAYSDSVPAGYVISQTVSAGKQVQSGTVIGVVVSKGPKPVAQVSVPDLNGMTYNQAKSKCSALGLSLSASGDTSSGKCVSQDPTPGEKVDTGTVVEASFA